jgi:hypothetical protein
MAVRRKSLSESTKAYKRRLARGVLGERNEGLFREWFDGKSGPAD